MKKSIIIVAVIVAAIILSVSVLAFININKTQGNSTPTPTPTPTPTAEPTLTPIVFPTPTLIPTVTDYSFSIVNTYPHDDNAFTEGLVYSNGSLYESTGLNGESSLRRVDLTTGNVLQEILLPGEYFGEGITVINNTIIQLTWQSNIGFIYDKNTFATLGNFTYPTEGWGLTYDGRQLIMSDGTDKLYFLNPTTFQQTGQVAVHYGTTSIVKINELEYINGYVYANIWQTNRIAIINPVTGEVKAWINLAELPAPAPDGNNVPNGIAYDQNNNRIFVTGKDWPNLYQTELVPED